jgi:F-type H+-transporting ATPase subunit epsilon
MADTVEFELVAPERLLVSTPVEMVVVPGAEGDFGVLPGHAPFISPVRTGVIDVYENGAVNSRIFVSGGFAEVTPQRCTVLADEAISLAEADRSKADERVAAARVALGDAETDDERSAAEAELAVAEALVAAIAASARS